MAHPKQGQNLANMAMFRQQHSRYVFRPLYVIVPIFPWEDKKLTTKFYVL